MQILMTKAARERLGERLTAMAPDADVVTVVAENTFERAGQPIAADDIAPEVVWISFDSFASKTVETLFARIIEGQAAPRWTQGASAGLDNPRFRAVMERGVRITKSSAQATPIAEYVIAHALSLLVPIQRQAALQAEHRWRYTHYREVGNTRWLLVGFGNIGHEIAKRIRPFGVDLTVVRRNLAPDDLADRVIPMSGLAAALSEADVIVLASALNDETRGMCDDTFFGALKPGAILINIGRGGLVDEDALRRGLDRDQPAHAVLDVFQAEPLPAESWFWDHPKVRVSGHTSNAGDGNLARGDALFLANLKRYVAGEALLNEADPSEVGLASRPS